MYVCRFFFMQHATCFEVWFYFCTFQTLKYTHKTKRKRWRRTRTCTGRRAGRTHTRNKITTRSCTYTTTSYRVYVFMYVCMHACVGACVHVCMCACVHVCVCVCWERQRGGVKTDIKIFLIQDISARFSNTSFQNQLNTQTKRQSHSHRAM